MSQILSLIEVVGRMMALIGIGCVAAHFKILSEKGRRELTELIVDLLLPCQVISGFIGNIGMFDGKDAIRILIFGTFVQAALLLLNRFMYRKIPFAQQAVMRYATAISNSAFIGVPLVGSIFGSAGTVCASIFVIPLRVNCFGIAINYFTPQRDGNPVKKILCQPTIIATALGMVIMLAGLRPPEFVTELVSSLAACTTPMCMIVIGAIIYSFAGQKADAAVYRYTFLRLVTIPLVVYLAFRAAGTDRVLLGSAVLLSAMPAGTTTALLADKYGADVGLAGRLVLVSTIASMITLPFWSYLCLYV